MVHILSNLSTESWIGLIFISSWIILISIDAINENCIKPKP